MLEWLFYLVGRNDYERQLMDNMRFEHSRNRVPPLGIYSHNGLHKFKDGSKVGSKDGYSYWCNTAYILKLGIARDVSDFVANSEDFDQKQQHW